VAEDGASVKAALSWVASTLTAEHMISAGMSSPWSVAKFAQTSEDAQQVWTLFYEAVAVSGLIALVTGVMLGGGAAIWWGLGGVALVSAYVGWEYYRALNGEL
jgi:hypothetical protein